MGLAGLSIILGVLLTCFAQEKIQHKTAKFTDSSFQTGIGNLGVIAEPIQCRFEKCPPGWSVLDYDLCALMRPNPAIRSVAMRDCLSHGAALTLLRADSERRSYNQFTMREIPKNLGLWLSAERRGSYWFTTQLGGWTYNTTTAWVPGQPDFNDGSCVYLRTDQAALNETYWGRMTMGDCDTPRHYSCEKSSYDTTKLICGAYNED